MNIDISIAILDKVGLKPNEYSIMTMLRKKEFDLVSRYLKQWFTENEANDFFRLLITKKYVTSNSFVENAYNWKSVKLSNTYKELINENDLFERFVEEYPKSVVRTDGTTDYLRTDLKSARLFHAKYTKLGIAKHEHLVACLKFEVDKRTREGSLKFMLRINKWLATEAWTAYQDELMDHIVSPDNNAAYGTEVE